MQFKQINFLTYKYFLPEMLPIFLMIDNVEDFYIADEYKNLIGKILRYGLVDGDLHLTDFDNWIGLSKIVNKYLGEKNIDVDNRLFNFEKFHKNLADVDNKVNIIEKYKPQARIQYGNLLAF